MLFYILQGSSTCDSLSDSGISDGDSDGAGRRARRLTALRELARRLQAALAPNSPAHRAITKVILLVKTGASINNSIMLSMGFFAFLLPICRLCT